MGQLKARLIGTAAIALMARAAMGASFHIPGGDLDAALNAYAEQSGVQIAVSIDAIKGVRTRGVAGNLSSDIALDRILQGTGLIPSRDPSGIVTIVPGHSSMLSTKPEIGTIQLAQATPQRAAVETVTVTSSKLGGADVQSIPIAITALSQEQLTATQTAGGPDLVKQVPNLTFSKTNFTGYNIQIRGIGTQAISVTTDPGVAVAFNDIPFIHNHFFEQEFYDVGQVEVLRGPQGTLYGRNATAGVVNVVSARPTDQFEAMLSADIGNYKNRRFEGMLNLPISDDRLALRVAGEWTKRDGYSLNELTGKQIDGRDLWSGRASLRWKPTSKITADFIWEHFQEDDDRLRSGKQLCARGSAPATILGQPTHFNNNGNIDSGYLNQNCIPESLYSPAAFGVPNSLALAYYGGLLGVGFGNALISPLNSGALGNTRDAYASTTQSPNLRVIESTLDPEYRAKNDTLELNAEWQVAPSLKLSSQMGYNHDFLWSIEDFNRFNTQPGIFAQMPLGTNGGRLTNATPDGNYACYDGTLSIGGDSCGGVGGTPTAYFCDPQLGCSNRLVGEDLSEESSWQFSQELRLTSDFKRPLNFSVGGNYLHYMVDENYYVFFNTLTMFAALDGLSGGPSNKPWIPGVSYNADCLPNGYQYADPTVPSGAESCLGYIDPNPLTNLNQQGHNYFLSQNPYRLNSYAMFGEAYYSLTKDVKLTGGLRWTDDQKRFIEIPSELLTQGYGYPSTGSLDQEWKEWTGRFVAEWSPQLSFTDQTMLYASYAHGYKAGGANPPGAVLLHYQSTDISNPTHPLTFAPEFNDAFELGSKNTAFDGALTLNADVFYYNYKGYQISEIVDRTSINLNFDATVKGAELQATWEPVPGLKFSFAGGYEHTRLADGSRAIDLMDRTAGNSNWVLVKPFVTQASNCVVPAYVVAYMLGSPSGQPGYGPIVSLCGDAYGAYIDPVTRTGYIPDPTVGYNDFGTYPIDPSYHGFDPLAGTPGHPYTGQNTYNGIDYGPVPNNGTGFYKDLSGNELPNAPHFTTSFSADYTMPISPNWAATLHGDFYWQAQSWARVINDDPYDRLRGYTNVNFSLILTETSGWQLMGYVKNVFNTTAITGTFLNTDDTGLTTNIFLTDPRLFGVRVTKNFDASGSDFTLFSGADGKLPQMWLTLGGDYAMLGAPREKYEPQFASLLPSDMPTAAAVDHTPPGSFDWDGKLEIQPEDSDWKLMAHIRYGRTGNRGHAHGSKPIKTTHQYQKYKYGGFVTRPCHGGANGATCVGYNRTGSDAQGGTGEQHTMLDFTLGKDVGLGLFGETGTNTISAGIRAVQFSSTAQFELNADPMYQFEPLFNSHWDVYDAKHSEWRSFRGIGPEVIWDAGQTIYGSDDGAAVTVDWGVNAALLFGRQKANVRHEVTHTSCGVGIGNCRPATAGTENFASNRSRRVVVPNLGGYAGLSVRYTNAKVSFGYRADTFFGAMDGGQEAAKDYNRGFYGPYLNVSLGLGG